MWHVIFKITLYYIREKQNRKEFSYGIGKCLSSLEYVCLPVCQLLGRNKKKKQRTVYIYMQAG